MVKKKTPRKPGRKAREKKIIGSAVDAVDEFVKLKQEAAAANKRGDRLQSKLDETIKGFKAQLENKAQELKNAKRHPHLLEEQLKVWVLTFNRLGIGVRAVGEWVVFRKARVDIRFRWDDLLHFGLPVVFRMFDPIQASAFDPQNNIDGVEGWQHPEDVQEQKKIAIEKANETLREAGLKINSVDALTATEKFTGIAAWEKPEGFVEFTL